MAVLLRADFDASRLRSLAKKAKDGPQARRLLALAGIYDGATRTEAAKIGGDVSAVIWTTTPWTIPHNRGLAFHPDYEYVVIATEKGKLLLAAVERVVELFKMTRVQGVLTSFPSVSEAEASL